MEFTLRPATLDDVPAITQLARARDERFTGTAEITEEEVAHDLAGTDVDLADDTRVALGPDGAILGYGDVLPDDEAVDITIWTPPDASPESRTAESHLMAFCEDRARKRARDLGAADAVLHLYVDDADTERVAILDARGYTRVRSFHRMLLPADAPTPQRPVPAGIDLRPLDPANDDEAVHLLLRDAFSEHGLLGVPADLAAWRHLTLDEPRWVPGPSLVALDNEQIAGAVVGFPEEGRGWVRHLGVGPEHRGRGLGAALLAGAIATFRARGLAEVGLGVDTGNRSAALDLYRSVGMQVAHQAHLHELVLAV